MTVNRVFSPRTLEYVNNGTGQGSTEVIPIAIDSPTAALVNINITIVAAGSLPQHCDATAEPVRPGGEYRDVERYRRWHGVLHLSVVSGS